MKPNGVIAPAQPAMRRWGLHAPAGRQFSVYAVDAQSALDKFYALGALRGTFGVLRESEGPVDVRELPRIEDEKCEYIDGRAAPGQ
jgi:hypothetical protein